MPEPKDVQLHVNHGIFQDTRLILDSLPVAITITDLDGIILFFNKRSSEILDRTPEHIGRNIRECHRNPKSVEGIDAMYSKFRSGRLAPQSYESQRGATRLSVILTVLIDEDKPVAVIQTVTTGKKG